MSAKKTILVITNMYPSKIFPEYGVFVQNINDFFIDSGVEIKTVFLKKTTNRWLKALKYFYFYVKVFLSYCLGKEDYVYIHYISHCALPVLFGRLLRKRKIVVNAHGGDLVQEKNVGLLFFKAKHYLSSKLIGFSSKIVCPSEYYKKEILVKKYNVDREKIFVSPSGGVNRNIFFPKEILPYKDKVIKLACIGRITEDKGVFDFLDALNHCNIINNIEISFYGNGAESDILKINEKINKLSLAGFKISRYCSQPQVEVANILRAVDALVFPSKRKSESLGLIGVESMACGTPVIGSNIGGISSYLINGYNGLSFEAGNQYDIAKTIEVFSSLKENEREKLRKNCLITASLYYSEVVNQNLLKGVFHE